MTENKEGFEIACDPTRNILRIRIWGNWEMKLARKFADTFRKILKERCTDGQSWNLLVDIRDFYPQTGAVQHMIRQQILNMKNQVRKIACLGERMEIQLKLNMHENTAECAFFESGEEGIQWLLT